MSAWPSSFGCRLLCSQFWGLMRSSNGPVTPLNRRKFTAMSERGPSQIRRWSSAAGTVSTYRKPAWIAARCTTPLSAWVKPYRKCVSSGVKSE